MISSVVADTDVLSFTFKQDTRAELYRPHLDDKLVIVSFMTIAELDRWAFIMTGAKRGNEVWSCFFRTFCFPIVIDHYASNGRRPPIVRDAMDVL